MSGDRQAGVASVRGPLLCDTLYVPGMRPSTRTRDYLGAIMILLPPAAALVLGLLKLVLAASVYLLHSAHNQPAAARPRPSCWRTSY